MGLGSSAQGWGGFSDVRVSGVWVGPVGFSIGLRMFVGKFENASELELNTAPHRT